MSEYPLNLAPPIRNLLFSREEPCYLLDLNQVTENIDTFTQSFGHAKDRIKIAYAYKANYHPKITELLLQKGCGVEAFSKDEVSTLIALGVPASKIICNGPTFTRQDMRFMGEKGVLFHLDNLPQAHQLTKVAEDHPDTSFTIGLRLTAVHHQTESRFGMNEEEAKQALHILSTRDNIVIKSLHTHVVEQARTSLDFAHKFEQLLQFYKQHPLPEIVTLNIGGGFYSPMPPSLAVQFNEPIPSIEAYGQGLKKLTKKLPPKLTLSIEPGSIFVANAMMYSAKVVCIKKKHILINGSRFDIQPTPSPRKLPLRVLHASSSQHQVMADITGRTGMENDIVYKKYTGRLAEGDVLIFENVGAYAQTLRPHFIHKEPQTLLVNEILEA